MAKRGYRLPPTAYRLPHFACRLSPSHGLLISVLQLFKVPGVAVVPGGVVLGAAAVLPDEEELLDEGGRPGAAAAQLARPVPMVP